MKTCSKCKELKELSDYTNDKKSLDGKQSQCKKCKVISIKNSPSHKRKNKLRRRDRKLYKREYHHRTKLARNISRRMRQSLNGTRKGKNWESLVDYTLLELKHHLESLFDNEMNWQNYGAYWHIDHKKPICSFDITDSECDEFKKCWSLNNLQPLKATDNLKKGDKLGQVV